MALSFVLLIIYLAFVSLGIPDGVLGVAWPEIRQTFDLPLAAAGYLSIIAAVGSITASFSSGHFIRKYGTGKIVTASAALTGLALLGFSLAPNFYIMAICFIPFGMGAGGVDAALNDYVSRHFSPRHMNWLHASWGIGAFVGPIIMTAAIVRLHSWRHGYMTVAAIQISLFFLFLFSMRLWKIHQSSVSDLPPQEKTVSQKEHVSFANKLKNGFHQVIARKGLFPAMLFYLCYTGSEIGLALWCASYFREARSVSKESAGLWVSCFFGCITIGRILVGIIVNRVGTSRVIHMGQITSFIGFIFLLMPFATSVFCPVGISLIGLGFAPMYPCMMQDSPKHFGKDFSQSAIGYQMGMANVGATFLPLFIGAVAGATTLWVIPVITMIFFFGTVIAFRFVDRLPNLLEDK